MSTKTTFKRIALVAVAAMGIGLLTAVPSQAVTFTGGQLGVTMATSITDSTTATGIAGANNFVQVTLTQDVTNSYAIVATGSTLVSSNTAVTGSGTASVVVASAASPGDVVLNVPTPTAGTITVKSYPIINGAQSATASNTITITVLAAAAGTTYNHSTAYIAAGSGSADATTDAAVVATPVVVLAPASVTPAAALTVRQYSSTDTATPVVSGSGTAVVVSISGGGSVSTASNGTLAGPSAVVSAGGTGIDNFYVYPNGVAGVGTITITVNGVVVATKAVTFAGVLASYKLGTPSKTVIGVGSTGTVVVSGLDSNGNPATLGSPVVTSGTTSVATVGISNGTITIAGVAVGTSLITVANSSTTPTITTTFTVTVGKATAKTVTITTDKASYAAGEKVVITVHAVGSDGTAVGDNASFAAFSSAGITSNVALQGMPAVSPTVALVGGVATYTVYAPLSAGTVTLNAAEGAGTDNVIANGTTAAAAITASFDVTNASADAAVDAANAATDAANYAADAADAATTAAQEATAAAQAAQDSADAATAAVVALGLRVNVLMASVRAQLTSLSNLLVRIIKKTHA